MSDMVERDAACSSHKRGFLSSTQRHVCCTLYGVCVRPSSQCWCLIEGEVDKIRQSITPGRHQAQGAHGVHDFPPPDSVLFGEAMLE